MSGLATKKDFPLLSTTVNCYPLVYLDSAATTQKPQIVIDKIVEYYKKYNANAGRGTHFLARKSSELIDNTRSKLLDFIGAYGNGSIVFTKNATEAINMVAWSFFYKYIKLPVTVAREKTFYTEGTATDKGILNPKDVLVITSVAEHHSNFLPWQRLQSDFGIPVKVLNLQKNGEVDYAELKETLEKSKAKVKVISVVHVSNVLGTINNLEVLSNIAKKYNAFLFIDATQSIARLPLNLSSYAIDALFFSGHKMYAETGIGGAYISNRLLEELDPFIVGGGGMASRVTENSVVWSDSYTKLAAGTHHASGIVSLLTAIEYLENIGLDKIVKHEKELTEYALEKLERMEFVNILGPTDAEFRTGVISFVIEGVDLTELSDFLDQNAIAIRVGHHCAQPLHMKYNVPASARISFGVYTTKEDIDIFLEVLNDFLFKLGQ